MCFSLFQSPRPLRNLFCTLTSLNSISGPNNQVCVLGAINECYEALCDVRMYVCMCLKGSVNYGQTVGVFFLLLHETAWVNMVLKVLNLQGQQNYMIGSKVAPILPPFFQQNKKNIYIFKNMPQACGVFIQRQQTGILLCALKT